MEGEPKPVTPELDSALLASVVAASLAESAQYQIDCLDLHDEVVRIIWDWFHAQREELMRNFQEDHPQLFPPKADLMERIRAVFPVERIHAQGSHPEFRRTKIIDNWVGEIYHQILDPMFHPDHYRDQA